MAKTSKEEREAKEKRIMKIIKWLAKRKGQKK